MKKILLLSLCSFAFAGCSSLKPVLDGKPGEVERSSVEKYRAVPLNETGTVDLKLRFEKDRMERIRYTSASVTKTYEGTQIVNERAESVDFLVQNKTTQVLPNGNIHVKVETLSKDGQVDLRDMAFPEPNEVLEMVYAANAKVLKAGRYGAESIFFVPPMSLPDVPVKVGETWALSHRWKSQKNGVELKLELTSILKNIYPCTGNPFKDKCAEIEISGDVTVPAAKQSGFELSSRNSGRLLISLSSGAYIWGDIRTEETFQSGGIRMEVRSCIESVLEEPSEERWPWRQSVKCDPADSVPTTVPGA
ncbi:MAG: hypothetical protein K2X47_19800 [Bdellovibrionales bacterium]|nr:hypothetical protein [Bdellovibrionales bacterium]